MDKRIREAGASRRWYHRNKESIKQRWKERVTKGLCGRCGKSPISSQNECERCRELANKRAKTRRKKFMANKDERRAFLIELKGGKCIDCGYNEHPAAFEFDHLRDKVAAISSMLNTPIKWERILAEVEKCELVCANCHRIRTHNRRKEICVT